MAESDSKDDIAISWQLDPLTLAAATNRQNRFVVPTAKMPNVLRIAVLFDIKEMPFKSTNFALPVDPNFWNYPDYSDTVNDNFRGKLEPITVDFNSSIQIVPNNSTLVSFDYTLTQVYQTLFIDDGGEAEGQLRCVVFEFELNE